MHIHIRYLKVGKITLNLQKCYTKNYLNWTLKMLRKSQMKNQQAYLLLNTEKSVGHLYCSHVLGLDWHCHKSFSSRSLSLTTLIVGCFLCICCFKFDKDVLKEKLHLHESQRAVYLPTSVNKSHIGLDFFLCDILCYSLTDRQLTIYNFVWEVPELLCCIEEWRWVLFLCRLDKRIHM